MFEETTEVNLLALLSAFESIIYNYCGLMIMADTVSQLISLMGDDMGSFQMSVSS